MTKVTHLTAISEMAWELQSESPRMGDPSSHVKAKLLGGPEVQVLEISKQSLVIHSAVRLRPGFGINLTVTVGKAQHEVRGRIVAVDAGLVSGSLHYRVGVKLDPEVAGFDGVTTAGRPPATEQPTPAPVPAAKTAPAPPESGKAANLQARLTEAERRAEQAESQIGELDARLAHMNTALSQATQGIQEREQALKTAEQREQSLHERLKSSETAWQLEREYLQAELGRAQARAEKSTTTVEQARQEWVVESKRLAAELESVTKERAQLQLEMAQAEIRARENASGQEHDRQELIVERDGLAARLEATEKWCTEQQELLYQIQQQISVLSGLFDGSKSEPDAASRDAGQSGEGTLRQVSA